MPDNPNNYKKMSHIQKKALKYMEKTGDYTKLGYVFEPFKGESVFTKNPHLPNCNSLFIKRVETDSGYILQKSSIYLKNQEDAIELIESTIPDSEISDVKK